MNLKFEELQKSNLGLKELEDIRFKSFKKFEKQGFPTKKLKKGMPSSRPTRLRVRGCASTPRSLLGAASETHVRFPAKASPRTCWEGGLAGPARPSRINLSLFKLLQALQN